MSNYRRAWMPGGCYFFTVNLQQRSKPLLIEHITLLRNATRKVQCDHPFTIHGWVVLPDHLHALISLPEGDCNYPLRWRLIKSYFSRGLVADEARSASRWRRGERAVWQRRYWEHLIRDENDFRAHMDYIHINPVKHGLVERVVDWPFSTFHRLVEQEYYGPDWGGSGLEDQLPYRD